MPGHTIFLDIARDLGPVYLISTGNISATAIFGEPILLVFKNYVGFFAETTVCVIDLPYKSMTFQSFREEPLKACFSGSSY
jgi:hypothetical protein